MIIIDTSALIDSLTGPRRSARHLRSLIESGERIVLPALVFYEWRRGPRLDQELAAQEALFPSENALPFGPVEAARACDLYRHMPRARGREIDLAIAAHALTEGATLWTLNESDFADVPGLELVRDRSARRELLHEPGDDVDKPLLEPRPGRPRDRHPYWPEGARADFDDARLQPA